MPPSVDAMIARSSAARSSTTARYSSRVDLAARLDPHLAHQLAFGAGLVRAQRHAEDLAGEPLRLGRRLRDLDAARLAASAGVHLRLHDDDLRAEPARGALGLGRRRRELARSERARRSRAAAPSPGTRGRSQLGSRTTSLRTWSSEASKSLRSAGVELELDDPLDAARAEHARHADVEALHAVLALAEARAGEHALLVLQDRLGHLDRATRPATRTPSRSSAGSRPRRRRSWCARRSRRCFAFGSSFVTGMPATVQ